MINSPFSRSLLSTGCHLKQWRAISPLSWEKNDFQEAEESLRDVCQWEPNHPAANGFMNKPFPHTRDGRLAGTLKAGAVVIGTTGGHSAYFCSSKNTSHITETAHPQPPAGPNLSLLEKSKLAETGQTFIYIV